jgi:hypothetical protein
MTREVWHVARSTVYAVRERAQPTQRPEAKKRGPKTKLTDSELSDETRTGSGFRHRIACVQGETGRCSLGIEKTRWAQTRTQ